jgi:RNA polymerase sigma-70 factor (ECF subfamily)
MANPGGPESFRNEELASRIAEHREDAVRVARRLVRSQAEAEDLAQTAILNVLRHAGNIEDPTRVKAYLLTSVRNLWRNQLRQEGRRRFVTADIAEHVAATESGPEERALTTLDASLARVAFESLSVTSRQVLELRYVQGLGFLELADRLEISTVAARQRAHRAREELIGACIEFTALKEEQGVCGSVRAKLGRYLRGRLTRRSRAQISLHLASCDDCGRCYAQVLDLFGHLLRETESDS